jgi:hypothetical protein
VTVEWLLSGYKVITRLINKRLQTISNNLLMEQHSGLIKSLSCTVKVIAVRRITVKEELDLGKAHSVYWFCKSM